MVSPDGWFLRANPACCTLLGYSEQELQGLRVRDITHPDDRAQSVALVDRALSQEERPWAVIKRYRHRDGSLIWSLLRTTLKRDADGRPIHFLSFLHDVTQELATNPVLNACVRRIQTLQEQERHRIARELHDELGQVLAALKLELNWLELHVSEELGARTAQLAQLVEGLVASVRRLSLGLRPPILDDLGLEAALDSLLQQTCGRSGIQWTFQRPREGTRFDAESRIALYRICQEGLTNVIRHAQASRVHLELALEGPAITLELADDGIGLGNGADRPTALGLVGIRERAELLGGSASLGPNTPRGTVLRVELPNRPWAGGDQGIPPRWG